MNHPRDRREGNLGLALGLQVTRFVQLREVLSHQEPIGYRTGTEAAELRIDPLSL